MHDNEILTHLVQNIRSRKPNTPHRCCCPPHRRQSSLAAAVCHPSWTPASRNPTCRSATYKIGTGRNRKGNMKQFAEECPLARLLTRVVDAALWDPPCVSMSVGHMQNRDGIEGGHEAVCRSVSSSSSLNFWHISVYLSPTSRGILPIFGPRHADQNFLGFTPPPPCHA